MFRRHVIGNLTAYHHGELTAQEKQHVEAHLDSCPKCRNAYDEIRFAAQLASTLSISKFPAGAMRAAQARQREVHSSRRYILALATAVIAVVAIVVFSNRSRVPAGPSWEVSGMPGTERLRPGDVLQTDASSAAQVKIADIGHLTLDPNTRIRLLATQANEHRIALDRGRLEAMTWAPPRLFIVETPTAKAVDLGCRYTLEVQDDGSSLLHVTLGLVALELEGRETVVPAGAFCRTRKGGGPGTPYFEDSSADLQAAVLKLDTGVEGEERARQLDIVIRNSRVRDGLSLWHLLPRMDPQSRALIYDRLAQFIPPPATVTRDGIVALDPDMLDSWKKVVSQLWQ
jgi:ferric-dicitrate binding protein FerR (iron transport regulator)